MILDINEDDTYQVQCINESKIHTLEIKTLDEFSALKYMNIIENSKILRNDEVLRINFHSVVRQSIIMNNRRKKMLEAKSKKSKK